MKAISYRQRVGLLALLCGCGIFLLVCRLAVLQVFDHEEWTKLADQLRSGWDPVRPLRGDIVDSKGRVLAHDAAGFELAVLPARWRGLRHQCENCGAEYFSVPRRCRRCREPGKFVKPRDERNLAPIARMLGMKVPDLEARVETHVKRVEMRVHKLLANLTGRKRELQRKELWHDHGHRPRRIQRDVPYVVAREVALHRRRNPAFVIRSSHGRSYPGGEAFAHILGRLTEAAAIEVERTDGTKRTLPTETGQSGLEYHYERELRGTPGWVQLERNPILRSRRVLEEQRAEPGTRIALTIDSEVQQRAASALGAVEGAFVVVHAETGAVLALVTSPRYDPEAYSATWKLWDNRSKLSSRAPIGSPFLERAFRSYQIPGSIMKPFTALAALRSGDGRFDEVIRCEREFKYRGIRAMGKLQCNRLHNELDMHGALRISCNIYFQTLLARMLDEGRFPLFVETGRRFGFGQPTGIEIQGRMRAGRGWDFDKARQPGTLIASAIGQGLVETSPAQIARAYAGLATGYLPRLRVVARVGDTATTPQRESLGIPHDRLERVRAALREVPRAGGSAPDCGLGRFQIACKTGTAQRGSSVYNAWMAGFAPARAGRPPVAFAMAILRSQLGGAHACGPRLEEFFDWYYRGGKE